MSLVLVGLSHRTAAVATRERYVVASGQETVLDEKLVQASPLLEAALIATCNRTELVGLAADADEGIEALLSFLHHEIGDGSAQRDQVYELRGPDVVAHVFSVAASLDSQVVGEAQILGQVKEAYRAAVAARSCGPVLNRLFQRAFRTGKRIRSETGLGASSVSIARVGVQLAREMFESFEGKRVLLLGAGEMAESAVLGLRDAGVRETVVVNRSLEPARRLAHRLHGEARTLDALAEELARADVVISSIQVDRPFLGPAEVAEALKHRHGLPILLIDLGMPRNVDSACQQLHGAHVYDMDDLEGVAEQGRSTRLAALGPARAIVAQEVARFERWQTALPLAPTIRQLRQRVFELAQAELLRGTPDALRASGDASAVTRMAEAIAAKILHRPLERLRAEAEDGTGPYYADAVRRLFELDAEEDGEEE